MKKTLLITMALMTANALNGSALTAQSTPSPTNTSPPTTSSGSLNEEFYGPFSSWANLKRDYGAKGDGIADDTTALQNALNDIGTQGKKNVLYIPAGTYRITKTLTGIGKSAVSILGQDPQKVTLRWDGPSGGTMFDINLTNSRISRITFDGAGKANILFLSYYSNQQGFLFPGQNEFGDDIFKDATTCLQVGQFTGGDDETNVLRSSFYRCNRATAVNDWNALQMFVRDSYFEDNGVGVTNSPGAGSFHVYSSVFKRSKVADIQIYNSGFFGIRDNYSEGSAVFFMAGGPTPSPAHITIEGNKILDPTNRAIVVQNRGPLMLIDNTIRNAQGNNTKPVFLGSTAQADVVSVGNTYTVAQPLDIIPANGDINWNRARSIQDQIVSSASINITQPTQIATPQVQNRQVFAVKAGATDKEIQAAINAAIASGTPRPIVFLPAGNYHISQSVVIPANTDLQLVGDGLNATFWLWEGPDNGGPILKVQGPTHATMRDFSFSGSTTPSYALSIENVDQPNAQLMMRQVFTVGEYLKDTGLSLENLDNLFIHALHSSFFGPKYSIKTSGGSATAAGQATTARFVQTGGNTATMVFASAVGATPGDGFLLTNGAKVLIRDDWMETPSAAFLNLGNNNMGYLTLQGYNAAPSQGGQFTINGFQGRIALLGGNFSTLPNSSVSINASNPNTNVLFLEQFFQPNLYTVTGTNSKVGFISSQVSDPGSAGRQYWDDRLNDSGSTNDQFVLDMLSQARADTALTPVLSTDPNTTSLSIIRVSTAGRAVSGIRVAH